MRKARVLAVAALVAFAGCSGGGGGDGGGGTGPAVFTSLSVTPSNVSVVVNGTQNLTVSAKDQNNATMSGLTTAFTSAAPAIATVTQAGVVTGVAVGQTTIAVDGTIGSVTKSQTVTVTVSTPGSTANVSATTSNTFDPSSVTITANGQVTWNFASVGHTVTFDNAAPAGGNIGTVSSPAANSSVSRTFAASGTYPYHCAIHGGMSGEVKVQ